MIRSAVLVATLAVAACGPTTRALIPQHNVYSPKMTRAFDDGRLPLFVVGGEEGDAARFAEAMSGYRNGVDLTFVPDGDTGASFGYRVVLRIEGRAGRVQEVCAPGAPLAAGGDDGRFANFAFCRGGTPVTTAVTPLPSPDDVRYQQRVNEAMTVLFPRRKDTGRNSDGGRRFYVL